MTPTTTGQAECLYVPQCLYMDLAFQEPTPTSVHGPPSDGSLANGGDLAPPCVCVTQWEMPSLLTSPALNSKGGNVLDLSFDEETVVSSHSFCSDFPRNACEGVIIDPSTCWLTAHLHRAGRAAPRRSQ